MKLSGIDFLVDSSVDKSVFVHLLKSCDISSLQSLSFQAHAIKNSCDANLLKTAENIGVTFDEVQRSLF